MHCVRQQAYINSKYHNSVLLVLYISVIMIEETQNQQMQLTYPNEVQNLVAYLEDLLLCC